MDRRDDISALYDFSERMQKVCQIFFWINMVAAISSALFKENSVVLRSAGYIQIIASILFVVFTIIDTAFIYNRAETARTKDALQNGFGISLIHTSTDGYFNNTTEPSLERYFINEFESVFFTKELSGKMIIKTGIICLVWVMVFLLNVFVVEDKDSMIVVAQSILSFTIVEDFVMLVCFHEKLKHIFEAFFREMISKGLENREQKICLLSEVLGYECTKAYYKVRLDSKLFNKCNAALSEQWNEIKEKIMVRSSIE